MLFWFSVCAENEHLQKAEICSEGQLAPLRRTFSCVVHYFRRICATLGCQCILLPFSSTKSLLLKAKSIIQCKTGKAYKQLQISSQADLGCMCAVGSKIWIASNSVILICHPSVISQCLPELLGVYSFAFILQTLEITERLAHHFNKVRCIIRAGQEVWTCEDQLIITWNFEVGTTHCFFILSTKKILKVITQGEMLRKELVCEGVRALLYYAPRNYVWISYADSTVIADAKVKLHSTLCSLLSLSLMSIFTPKDLFYGPHAVEWANRSCGFHASRLYGRLWDWGCVDRLSLGWFHYCSSHVARCCLVTVVFCNSNSIGNLQCEAVEIEF